MIKKTIYAREFNERIPSWTEDRDSNLAYLKVLQGYYNELLMARGYVFLRDIYENLGIPITKESIVVGWYYDPRDKSAKKYIDFNLENVDGGPNFLLNFNVDGDIREHF